MLKLTSRQQQIFELIKDQIDTTGYPPTRAEIAQMLVLNPPTLRRNILRP